MTEQEEEETSERDELDEEVKGRAMRKARRASNVEVPSFLRQMVKETGKLVTFFFKGEKAEGVSGDLPDDEDGMVISPYLDRPILEKHTAEGETKWGASYALASMQGWRVHMEDAHTCTPEIEGDLAGWSYFAVFDGHAGSMVAQYCSNNLLDHILATGNTFLTGKHKDSLANRQK